MPFNDPQRLFRLQVNPLRYDRFTSERLVLAYFEKLEVDVALVLGGVLEGAIPTQMGEQDFRAHLRACPIDLSLLSLESRVRERVGL
ncbi:MAG: hypothetical protein AAF483_18310 [Planctomycetota bacterium]